MRRDQVDKKIPRKGLAPMLQVQKEMTSVVYKRLKCHTLHVDKSCFGYMRTLPEN